MIKHNPENNNKINSAALDRLSNPSFKNSCSKKSIKVNSRPAIVWPTMLMLTITPLVALIGVIWYQIAVGFEWIHWIAFIVFAALNGISITVGYHRLWSHNAYKAHPIMKLVLALFGAAAFQNSILLWSSQHRRHHRYVDDDNKDPYSAGKGLWFSHIGWMLRHYPNGEDDFSNCRDLQRDKIVMWQHNHYLAIALTMNVIPPLLLGAITGDYLAFILTAGFLRLVYSHHTTFFINSLAHYWGRRPYSGDNSARDNGIVALLTYGEGYDNYHHVFQSDYRNGVRWYHYDPSKWVIKCCSWIGLAKDLRVTPKFKIRQAMVLRQLEEAKEKLYERAFYDKLKQRVGAIDYSQWRSSLEQQIEQEYQQLSSQFTDWKNTREQWLKARSQQLVTATRSVQGSLDIYVLKLKLKELDFSLKQQYRRVSYFNLTLA